MMADYSSQENRGEGFLTFLVAFPQRCSFDAFRFLQIATTHEHADLVE